LILDTPLTRVLLFLSFSLAFLISPYWILVPGTVLPSTVAIVTVGVGILWSRYNAAALSLEVGLNELMFFILILATSLLWNWNALTIDLAWRGDEDDHFSYVLSLLQKARVVFNKISGFGFLLVLGVMGAIIFVLWSKRRAWFYGLAAVTVVAVIALAFVADRYVEFDYLLRYPYINRWLHSIPVIVLNAAGVEATEKLYRIIPILSTSLLAFVAFHFLREHRLSALLASLFVLTIPIINYYTTVLYLEMPSVLLFTVALLAGEKLLQSEFGQLKQSLSWYALLLSGFVKETVLPVLVVIIGLRGLYQLRYRSGRSILNTIKHEFMVILSVLLPIAVYLGYRLMLSEQRPYNIHLGYLVDPEMWFIMLKAIVDQMLTPAILALSGAVVLILQRRLFFLLLLLLSGMSSLVFFAVDNSAYWGYSRFNLFFVPPMLVGSLVFFRYLLDKGRKNILYVLVVSAIVVNIVQRPMDLSGVRTADWGVYRAKTAEYYYPYRDALFWVYNHAKNENILISGADYPYKYGFYTDLWQWQANIKQDVVRQAQVDVGLFRQTCLKAAREGYSVLVFQMVGTRLLDAQSGTSCQKQKSFRYGENEIVIYFVRLQESAKTRARY